MKVRSESEVAQSYPTVSDPMDCSLPGSSIYGIFQARVLEWVAIAFSAVPAEHGVKVKVKVKSLSWVRLLVTPWTAAYQAPVSMGFSRQEYWSGLPFPSPGNINNSGINILSVLLPATSILQRVLTCLLCHLGRYGNSGEQFCHF